MNLLRRILALFSPRIATEPVQTTVIALAPESQPRPWTPEELREIDAAIGEMLSVGKAPRSAADATAEVRRERMAAGPLDTRAADLAIDAVQNAARRTPPIVRKQALRKAVR